MIPARFRWFQLVLRYSMYRKIGIVNHLYIGKDNIIRVAELRIGKKLVDQPIELLYPMELRCDGITTKNGDEKKNELNPSATDFRLKQTAAEIAKWPLKDTFVEEDGGNIW